MLDASAIPQVTTESLFPDPAVRADRILRAKLRVLYRGLFAVPTNLFVATVVVILLRNSFPLPLLAAWYCGTAVVAGARLVLHKRFRKAMENGQSCQQWPPYFCVGALGSGMLWGALCLGLPFYGTLHDYVLLTLVAAGMSAGALTTLASYLPAYLCYACAYALPIAGVSLINPSPEISTNGWLILFYTAMVCAAGLKLNRDVTHTIELQVDNEALNASLSRTRVERDIARTEKWSMMSHLSHELRTPLNAILGFSETMLTQVFGPLGHPRYEEYVAHVHRSGKHLFRLIGELLQLSQSETRSLALAEMDLDIAATIASCLDDLAPCAKNAGIDLTTSVPSDLPRLRADSAKLRQILFHLTDNAIKFTGAEGRVTIDIGVNQKGGIDLVVRDSGIGMSPQELAVALEPFGRVASPLRHETSGMGLGLPICRRLVELHGGKLRIESATGEGTVCTVSFPPSRTVTVTDSDAPSGGKPDQIGDAA